MLINSKNPEIATPETIFRLRNYYYDLRDNEDFGSENELKLSKKLLYKAAKLNHPKAICEIADNYYCEKNFQKAIYWYKKAIERGNRRSMMALGLIYFEGEIVPLNYDEAFNLFKASDSWYRLGICYAKSYGTAKDEAKAIECFKNDEYGKGDDEWAFSRLAYINSDDKSEELKYT